MTAAEPASQGAFANKYSIFVDTTHIDNANVLFPDIANRNRAGDSPSHFVSTFLTVKGVQEKRVSTKVRLLTDLWNASAHCSGIGKRGVKRKIKNPRMTYGKVLH